MVKNGVYNARILKYVSPFFNIMHSLRNSGAKYVGNKMRWRFQNFSGCLGNTSAKKTAEALAEICVYYVGNNFGIPWHFARSYVLYF